MTAVRISLWYAVLLSCSAFHSTADHRSTIKPYKRLAIGSNTTTTKESIRYSDNGSSTLLPTWTEQNISPPRVSSGTSSTIRETSSANGPGFATPSDSHHGESPISKAQNSEAGVFGGTTLASPPLTTSSVLASQTNSTILAFPTFSLNTTSNVTTTGWYTNSTTTPPSRSTAVSPTTTQDFCTTSSYGSFSTVIEWSIIYTWTITWFGDPADYTPPFPTISIPKPCTPTTSATGRSTASVCDSSERSCSLVHTTGDPAVPSITTDPWWVWISDTSAIRGMEPTLTFVTTDKNPAVVFPTSLPPDYGGPPDPMENVHSAPLPNQAESPSVPSYGNEATTDQNVRSTAVTTTTTPPITVTVKPSVVVIDDRTFTDNPAQPTSKVVVDGNTFTINPTQVVGVGATITRPPNSGRTTPPPTKTTIGGIGVAIEGSSVAIDNTSFTIGPRPTTVVIEGQTITLKPGVIVFPSQTLAIPVAQETTQVVVGAELITAVGSDRAIIEGRTITYGPGSSTITEVIDEDTVLVGPSGIIVHDETYGGNKAKSTDVQFVVAGGVTISRIGPTVVVIQGVTYTLEPLPSGYTYKKTTTVLGGETITIGPEGVAIETWTLNPPYVSITTITPSNGAVMALPTATAVAVNTNKESNGPSLASRQPPWALPACIATITSILGVWILQ